MTTWAVESHDGGYAVLGCIVRWVSRDRSGMKAHIAEPDAWMLAWPYCIPVATAPRCDRGVVTVAASLPVASRSATCAAIVASTCCSQADMSLVGPLNTSCTLVAGPAASRTATSKSAGSADSTNVLNVAMPWLDPTVPVPPAAESCVDTSDTSTLPPNGGPVAMRVSGSA